MHVSIALLFLSFFQSYVIDYVCLFGLLCVSVIIASIHLGGTLNISLNGAPSKLSAIDIPLMYSTSNITGSWNVVNLPRGHVVVIGGVLMYRPGDATPDDNNDNGMSTRLIISIAGGVAGLLLLGGLLYYCCRRTSSTGSSSNKPLAAQQSQPYAKYTAVGEF
jgi:hypothetical protein